VTVPVQVQAPHQVMRSAPRAASGMPSLAGLGVSSPHDSAEREAAQVARRVISLPASPASASSGRFAGLLPVSATTPQRAPARGAAAPTARPTPAASRPGLPSGSGQPLPRSLRDFMEPRFGTDFSAVRLHTGPPAAQASRQLNAAAFTVGHQIFFGRDAYQPDSSAGRELIAHELTHTIQQGAVPQSAAPVRRRDVPAVSERSAPSVQRLGISDALDYFAEHANHLPGFRMFTLVLGVNPINLRAVDRSPANLLRAVVELMPGGALITRALDNHGIVDRVAGWVQQQLASLGMVGSSIRQAVDRFLDSLGWRDIFDLGGVWERAKRLVTEPIARITSFVGNLVSGVLQFIRDAILRPLAGLAQGTRGWDLLCAVLGRNPITGDPVPRTAETLIGGFMRLIGQEEVWQNIQRGNAIGRAWAWFQGALAGLMGFVTALPGMFLATLRSLGVADLVTLPQTFARIARVFGDFAGRFFSWAGQQIMRLLEIIFEVVAPSVMPYLRRAAGALRTIIGDPIRFIGNLVRAAVQGLRQFAGRFLTHLRASLIGWLTGAMGGAGVYIPQAFSLPEIIKFVLSVLGLTWQNIRGKLVRAVGETAVAALETGFDIVVTLVREGPAAAWERIRESLSNLREMVMEQVMTFVRNNIVTAAITRLVSSLNPAGAFIQAIIAIYNTVMFFIERMRQIAQVAGAVIDSIAAIASGAIAAAANRVEQTMAGLLTLVISFLARLVGLGRVSDAVTNIINRIRQPIDRALERVVEWIVAQARRLGRFVAQAGVPNDPNERLRLASRDAATAARALRGRVTEGLLQPTLALIRTRYGLTAIQPYEQGGQWWVRASINPVLASPLGAPGSSGPLVGPDGRTPAAQYVPAGGGARSPEGPDVMPLLGKLRQAVEMFTLWTTRGSPRSRSRCQQMLRLLETARDATQHLGEDRARGVPLALLQPRLQALQNQLRAIQELDPRYRLISIGALAVTLGQARRQMSPRVAVTPWVVHPDHSNLAGEYRRQLRDQQDGINAMVADQWIDNRNTYANAGRSAVGERMQATFQRRSGHVPETAAPHNPDQIGAGFPDPTGLPAHRFVNSHIGSQWPSRIGAIDTAVAAIDALELPSTQINVALSA
jgi:hypothetical protein